VIRLRIRLTPMEPYFLGGERCDTYGTFITQQAAINPYFLRSGRIPSQSALFGILRYLGIRNPQSDYSIGGSTDYIGSESYDLTAEREQHFGKIIKISELMLADSAGDYWCLAPKNHICTKDSGIIEYDRFEVIRSLAGKRYLPIQYKEKNEGNAMFARLTKSADQKNKWLMAEDVFDSTIQVGINRSMRNDSQDDEERSGFFKREYVVMKPGYSFVFFAELEDDAFGENIGFTKSGTRMVSVGRYRAMFRADWEAVSEQPAIKDSVAAKVFEKKASVTEMIDENTVQTHPKELLYAWALSDTVYSGEISQLREACVLMIGDYREQRVFTTNYAASSARGRYSKAENGLKLISAGTVFVFENEQQKKDFKARIEGNSTYEHGKTAGYNRIYYSGKD